MASFAFSLSNNHTIVAWIYAQDKPYPDVFKMFYDIPFARKFIPSTTGSPYTVTKAFESVLGDPIPYKWVAAFLAGISHTEIAVVDA